MEQFFTLFQFWDVRYCIGIEKEGRLVIYYYYYIYLLVKIKKELGGSVESDMPHQCRQHWWSLSRGKLDLIQIPPDRRPTSHKIYTLKMVRQAIPSSPPDGSLSVYLKCRHPLLTTLSFFLIPMLCLNEHLLFLIHLFSVWVYVFNITVSPCWNI